VALLLYIIWWLLSPALSALIPFIVGIVLAYLILPLVNRLDQAMPRWLAILLVYMAGIVVISGVVGYLVPLLVDQITQLIRLIPSLQELQATSNRWLDQYQQTIASIPPALREPLENAINQAIRSLQSNITSIAQNVGTLLLSNTISLVSTVATTVGFVLGFLLVPFWLFYVLMDQRNGLKALDNLIAPRIRADFWAVATIIDRVLSNYVRGQLFLGLVVGSAAGLGLLVLNMFGFRVDYILLLAVIAGITELIPVIGPIIGAIPAIVLGFLDSPTTGVAVLILYILIQQLENHLLVPRIVGDAVDIHPAILMVLLVVYAQAFGLIGAIISAPLSAVVRDVFVYIYGRLSEPPKPAGLLPGKHGEQDARQAEAAKPPHDQPVSVPPATVPPATAPPATAPPAGGDGHNVAPLPDIAMTVPPAAPRVDGGKE
jgi:predicted PurR-regulated permease PerM